MFGKPACFTLLLAAACAAREPVFDRLWDDPEVQLRIRTGIETNRMGFATLRFTGAEGKPAAGVDVDFNQTRHQFLFGCNIFLLGGFPSPEQNRRYEELFRNTFNFATAPFYWSDLEPEPGKLRFGVDSPFLRRRPPPDLVLEFCRRHNIVVKGHNLIWHSWYPGWLPPDQDEVTRLTRRRFEQIAERYGNSIPIWDVVNEPLERRAGVILPRDYTYWSMREAGRLFPPGAVLMVNEVTSHWNGARMEESPFYLLLQNLFLRGARVDAIGLQYHLFSERLYKDVLAGKALTPREMLQALDLYARFQKPLHITEITVPALPAGPEGEEDQARLTRNLYRLWFSHAGVEAITWWNLADGTSAPGEDKWGGGLVRQDFSPKPSYKALDDLMNGEWRTRVSRNSGSGSVLRLHGFYGDYEIIAKWKGKTVRKAVRLSRAGTNDFTIRFE